MNKILLITGGTGSFGTAFLKKAVAEMESCRWSERARYWIPTEPRGRSYTVSTNWSLQYWH